MDFPSSSSLDLSGGSSFGRSDSLGGGTGAGGSDAKVDPALQEFLQRETANAQLRELVKTYTTFIYTLQGLFNTHGKTLVNFEVWQIVGNI